MPSPIGHVLGGIAAGRLITGHPVVSAMSAHGPAWRRQALDLAIFGLLGVLPDIDFLFGTHSTYTHSLGAAAVVALIAWVVLRPARLAIALAAGAAYASHVLLDWLGSDDTPPIGIMALWPFTNDFYQSDLYWFMAISRRYWLPGFWTHNLTAVFFEVVFLGPVALAIAWWRLRADRGLGNSAEPISRA